MRLKYQLFLVLLISGVVLVLLMFAYNTWSFNRGFINYINESEKERLSPLIEQLAEHYAAAGNWQSLAENRTEWNRLLRQSGSNGKRRARSNDRDKDKRGDRKKPPPGAVRSTTLTFDPRLLLADAEKNILIGPSKEPRNMHWIPINNDQQTVGFLGLRKRTELTRQLDQVFAQQQKRGFAYSALVIIALSAILAAFLASRIVKPILRLSTAVKEIGRGDYQHRIKTARKDELGVLSRNVNQLAHTLERNLDTRRQWIAEISHELRTPVAVLQSEIEAIQDGVKSLDSAAINSLHAETLRLGRLINDLHELSMSDVGALNYQMDSIDLAALLAERLSVGSIKTEENELTLTWELPESPVQVYGDAQRLAQLFDNLLHNSCSYTNAGGSIEVTLSFNSQMAKVQWHDSAPAVSDEQLPKLFDSLFRTEESRNRNTGGSGLGLAIAQKIVVAHQGKIEASQSKLGGLAIDIEFPLTSGTATPTKRVGSE